MGQAERGRQNDTARTGLAERERQNSTGRQNRKNWRGITGSQNRTGKTGQDRTGTEQNRKGRTGQAEQDRRNMISRIRLSEQE